MSKKIAFIIIAILILIIHYSLSSFLYNKFASYEYYPTVTFISQIYCIENDLVYVENLYHNGRLMLPYQFKFKTNNTLIIDVNGKKTDSSKLNIGDTISIVVHQRVIDTDILNVRKLTILEHSKLY